MFQLIVKSKYSPYVSCYIQTLPNQLFILKHTEEIRVTGCCERCATCRNWDRFQRVYGAQLLQCENYQSEFSSCFLAQETVDCHLYTFILNNLWKRSYFLSGKHNPYSAIPQPGHRYCTLPPHRSKTSQLLSVPHQVKDESSRN